MPNENEIYDVSRLTTRQEEPMFTPLPMIMEEAAKTNPGQFAESSRISRLTGLPIETVQSDLTASRAHAKAVEYDLTGLVQRSPVTGEFLKSYKNSVFAQNDVMTLEDIERVYNESANRTTATQNVTAVSRAVPGGLLQGIGMGTSGIGTGIEIGGRTMQRIADFMLPEAADKFIWENPADKYLQYVDPAAFLRARGEGTQQLGQMVRGTEAQSLATDIAGGVGQMLGQAVMHIFAPQLSGAMMFGQGIEQQRERQEATGTYGESGTSDLALVTGGLATLALEKTGIEQMLNRIPPKVKNDLTRKLADVFIAGGIEGVQEVVEGVTQSLIERVSTNADAPLLEGAIEEGAVGFGVGAIVRSLILTATPGRLGEAVAHDQGALQRGQQDMNTLDNLSELIGSTELRQLSQESFHEFVSRLNSDGNTHVYIDAAQLDLYLREQKKSAIPDPALILLSEQADEARSLGVAVTIPIQDFATVVAATPHYDALREAMTLSADATPVYRQQQAEWEAENYMTLLVKQAQDNVTQYAEAQNIYESIKQQLIDTGRVSPRNASTMAQIVPAWATVYAQKTGKSIAEIYAESGLTIVGPQTGKKASLAQRAVDAVRDVFGLSEPAPVVEPNEYQVPESDAVILAQARETGYQGVDAGEAAEWRAGVQKFGAEGMTPEARMARAREMGFDTEQTFYHGTAVGFSEFQSSKTGSLGGGVYLTTNPSHANAYAQQAYTNEFYGRNNVDSAPQIVAVHISAKNLFDATKNTLPNVSDGQLAERLKNEGYDGIYAGDEIIIFDPSNIRSVNAAFDPDFKESANLLAQESQKGARGYYNPENAIIRLTESSDLSTFLHEFAHFMFEMEKNVSGETLDSIYRWFKRNADDVAAEANGWLGDTGQLAQAAVMADTIDIDGVQRPTTDSNGQPIAQTEEGVRNFWAWFGDSKVVDDQGRPLVVYHGTAADFTEFKVSNIGTMGPGIYFAFSRDAAQEWANRYKGGRVIEVYLHAENPVEIANIGEVSQLYDRFAPDGSDRDMVLGLRREGYDAAWATGSAESVFGTLQPEIAVYDPTQIKSAIGNTGAFDPANPNILNQSIKQGSTGTGPVTADDVIAYVDNGTTGDKLKDRALYVATHEQFARAWEQYLMEGKAPSTELHNIFQTFARWMVEVYEKIKGALRVNLDDEMRQVFDRMVATEEQIKAAEARAKIAPLFTDAAMAGMTEEAYRKYQEKAKKVSDKAAETLREKLIKQLTRQTEAWWINERNDVAGEVLLDLRETRTYRTIDALRFGSVKLDKAAVKEMVGDLRISRRGVEFSAVPRQLNNMTLDGMQGVHPDEAAALFGYGSGSELLDDIMKAKPIAQAAQEQAEQIMRARHGDILNDGSIQREADEALQNEDQAKLILAELKALNRKINVDRINIKDMAERKIAQLSYREINTNRYRAAELRAAQEAARMMAEGNVQGAADAKMRQLMNHYLARAALDARNSIEKIQGEMARYNKKSIQEAIAKAEGGYWQQIEKILIRFEFRKSATLKGVDKLNENIQAWAADKIENEGDALLISDAAADESYVTHWKNVPFSELQGIADTVKNIEHVARYANKITLLGEQRDFDDVVNMWTQSIDARVKSVWQPKIINTVEKESPKRIAKWAMAKLTKIPYMMSWLDGGERLGISHQLISGKFNDALHNEYELYKQIAAPVIDAIKNRSPADRKRHMRTVFIEEIGENMKINQVLAVALNVGNQGNLKKLLLGEGWADPRDPNAISLNNPKLQAVLKHMTKSDWELVQKIWDQMELLYPMLEEVHRKSTGLTPPKVVATPVQTPFGEFRGGYYPLKGDPNRSNQVQKNQTKLDAATDSMFSTFGSIHASVFASATQERTGVYYPIDLNLDVVPNHFQEVIHFITHHDAVKQVNKLLNNDKVATSIKKALGPEEFALLRPWLNDIAKDGRQSGFRKGFMDPAFARLRFGVTLGVMGFRATTGIIQLSGISNAISETGLGNMLKAVRMILDSLTERESAKQFAFARSKVLKHRMNTMNREMRDVFESLQGKRGTLAALQEASMKHIAFIQTYFVDIPSWYAGYVKELGISGDEQKAAEYGDWVIEQIQGSGATKDMSELLREPSKATRLFTMFMTFFSAKFNRDRDAVRGARSGRYSTTSIAGYLMAAYTIPVLIDMLLRGELGGDDEDDEDTALEKMATTTAMYAVGGIPFVRDVANAAVGEYSYSMSPIARIMEGGIAGTKQVMDAAVTDDEATKAQVKALTEFTGAVLGIPGVSQAWITGEELYDVLAEGEDLSLRELFLFRGEE